MPRARRELSRLKRLKAVAYHEAGHAVVAIETGRRFKSVSIVSAGETAGHVLLNAMPRWFQPYGEIDDRHRLFIDREILIDFSGDAAWRRCMRCSNWIGSASDRHCSIDLASYLYGGRVREKNLSFMRERAMDTVRRPRVWTQIEGLVEAHMEQRELSERSEPGSLPGVVMEGGGSDHARAWR